MIELRLEPGQLLAERPNKVTITIRNTGVESCTKVSARLSIPADLVLVAGTAQIYVGALSPDKPATHSLTLRPRRSGTWRVTTRNGSYRDASDQRCDLHFDQNVIAAAAPPVAPPTAATHRCGVFICYRRIDCGTEAAVLYEELRKHLPAGCELFRDNDSIPPGAPWRKSVTEELQRACRVLVLIGSRWLHADDSAGRRRLDLPDDPVRLEIESALNSKPPDAVIPVLYTDIKMPASADLPSSIQQLPERQAFRIEGEADVVRLAVHIAYSLRRRHAG